MEMNRRIAWDEFRNNGFLWFVNRMLHIFGYALTVQVDEYGKVTDAYPSRCRFRGFNEKSETTGFEKIAKYMVENASDISKDLENGTQKPKVPFSRMPRETLKYTTEIYQFKLDGTEYQVHYKYDREQNHIVSEYRKWAKPKVTSPHPRWTGVRDLAPIKKLLDSMCVSS